ncbi:MAG: hypothetical protein LBP59_18125 [Planctomycetaceae bacterium]|nr:hypothetical protein [Planctomycetaceae bacterium]
MLSVVIDDVTETSAIRLTIFCYKKIVLLVPPVLLVPIYCSYLKFSDLKASKPAVRKLGRRR